MFPIANHLIISPHAIVGKSSSGINLVMDERPFVGKATVVEVSQNIKQSPVQKGDAIAYLAGQEKWQNGICLLNIDHVEAKL
jgi:hypothetical protein